MSNLEKPDDSETLRFTIQGFSWNLAGNFTHSIAGLILNVVLARLLGPEPFGLVALALLVVGIGNLIIESGLGSALIQKEEIDSKDIAFVFTLQMLLGVGLALLVIASAPWLALLFSNPESTPVLRAMAILLVFRAFCQVSTALLRRKFNFKRLQLAQIVSFFVGNLGFGLPLALAGFGVWSLVAAQLVQSILNALIVYLSSRHSFSFTIKGSNQLALFGLRILGANIANWIIHYIDQAFIGRRFGAESLGYYNRAIALNWTPTGVILSSAQASLFSAISRMGKSIQTIKIFTGLTSAFAIFFFSIYWIIGAEAQNIILVIYGSAWIPAAALLTPLALAIPLLALVGLEGPILNGLGKPEYEMRVQWITATIAILVLATASKISLIVTAWSIILIYIFRYAFMSLMTVKVLEISWLHMARPLFSGFLMGGVAILAWYSSALLIPENISLLLKLLLKGILTSMVWLFTLFLGRKWFFPEMASFVCYLLDSRKIR